MPYSDLVLPPADDEAEFRGALKRGYLWKMWQGSVIFFAGSTQWQDDRVGIGALNQWCQS
jgi:hypothetical protein